MIYFLSDNNNDINNHKFIKEGLNKEGYEVIYICSPHSSRKIISWIKGVLKILYKSRKADTIICWYDFQAILCFHLGCLINKRRKIIALNILLKNKNTIKNSFVSFLYKKALNNKNVRASITSNIYGEDIRKKLKSNLNFFLIRDVYQPVIKNEPYHNNGKKIFCGGHNGRDWNKVFEIAQKMQDYDFTLVMPAKIKEQYKHKKLKNTHLFTNIPFNKFISLQEESTFILLPLNTNAPAGLIVMFQAASMGKLVITNETSVTNEYIGYENGILVKNESSEYAKMIEFYYKNDDKSAYLVRNFQQFLKKNCSEELYVKGIIDMLKTF